MSSHHAILEPSPRSAVEDFVSQKTLAVVGASRQGKKFGNYAYRRLKAQGYRVFAVHPSAERIEGDACYPSLAALPEPVGGALIVLPPERTQQVVQEAAQAGVPRVWMQQGAESEAAIQACRDHHMQEVHGQCILMFAEPVRSFHRVHRGLWRLLRKLPR